MSRFRIRRIKYVIVRRNVFRCDTCLYFAYASFSSINDFIINNVNGFSITPYKQEEYISKLEMLMMDVDLRIKLAKEAKKMTKSFSLESVTDKWIDLFSTL